MSVRNHSRRRDILDQPKSYVLLGFFSFVQQILYLLRKKNSWQKKRVGMCEFRYWLCYGPFCLPSNLLSILIELCTSNWRSQCEEVKAVSGCYALTDPQKGAFIYANEIKMKAGTRDNVAITKLWCYIFSDDCNAE